MLALIFGFVLLLICFSVQKSLNILKTIRPVDSVFWPQGLSSGQPYRLLIKKKASGGATTPPNMKRDLKQFECLLR